MRADLGGNQIGLICAHLSVGSWNGCYWKAWVHALVHRHGGLRNHCLVAAKVGKDDILSRIYSMSTMESTF